MNAQEIRKKYRQILQEPESDSQNQWGKTYLQSHQQKRKRILTQSNSITTKKITPDKLLIGLKEKLAQCLSNLNKKDSTIEQLHLRMKDYQEENRMLKKQLLTLKNTIAEQQKKVIKQKVTNGSLENEISSYENVIHEIKIDKQMMQKQVHHYRSQIDKLKNVIRFNDKKYYGVYKEMQKTISYKKQNYRLKEDIKRLHILVNQYSNIKKSLEGKHYLGKGYKQSQNWFPENLIGEVQLFLKNHQIGLGNKQFIHNLVKFIQLYTQKISKKNQNKVKKLCSSRIKNFQRRHYQSFHSQDIQHSTIKRNNQLSNTMVGGNSNKFYTALNESKRYTESFIFDKVEKSIAKKNTFDQILCLEILESFQKSILQLLNDKQIRKKKIIKLVNWFVETLTQIFEKTKYDQRNSAIKITN